MKKKMLALALVVAMSAGTIAGCGKKEETTPPPASTTGDAAAPEGGDAGSDYEPQKLKMNVTTSETSTWYLGAVKLKEDMSEATGGKVDITVYPNEQLSGGNMQKGIEMIMSGATDLDLHSNIIYSVVDEKFSLLSLPFLFKDLDDVDAKLAGEAKQSIIKVMEEKGVKWLGFGENGFRQLTNSKKEVKTVADMKGLKIRIPGMNMYVDVYTAMGANPVSMNWSETFTALQQGAVDGQENPADLVETGAVDEVQKYMTLWNYSYDALLLGINKKLYDSYPADLQKLFSDKGFEAAEYQKNLVREVNDSAIEKMKADSGLQVYVPTEEELQTFKDATADVMTKYEGIIGKEFIDPFRTVQEDAKTDAELKAEQDAKLAEEAKAAE